MTLPSSNPEFSREDKKFLIDKNEAIHVLKKLIDDYPSDTIPRDVVEDALVKIIGDRNLESLSGHPAFKKFEQTIAKAKSICPS